MLIFKMENPYLIEMKIAISNVLKCDQKEDAFLNLSFKPLYYPVKSKVKFTSKLYCCHTSQTKL